MTRLEDELRAALRREEPPAGFAEGILALAAQEERRRERSPWFRFKNSFAVHRLRWAAAAAGLAVAASGVGLHVQEQRRAEGEAAKRQVMVALRITSEKWKVAAKEIGGKANGDANQSQRDARPNTENPE